MRIAKNNYTKIRNLIYNIDKNVKDKYVTSFVEINPQNLSWLIFAIKEKYGTKKYSLFWQSYDT